MLEIGGHVDIEAGGNAVKGLQEEAAFVMTGAMARRIYCANDISERVGGETKEDARHISVQRPSRWKMREVWGVKPRGVGGYMVPGQTMRRGQRVGHGRASVQRATGLGRSRAGAARHRPAAAFGKNIALVREEQCLDCSEERDLAGGSRTTCSVVSDGLFWGAGVVNLVRQTVSRRALVQSGRGQDRGDKQAANALRRASATSGRALAATGSSGL
ncbi:hypothetical protein FA95DRAFT_1577654 [Auriscalpium vulgare]|uniref:Uncharacterized protein n=1 Tax=Auriscalpium vulgare TaxID=40419 RepID=A0ACB8R5R2_9AGAM|nr:hypothetical protein FA95DRAFT_1577654 [Auriscalpium vulgare]